MKFFKMFIKWFGLELIFKKKYFFVNNGYIVVYIWVYKMFKYIIYLLYIVLYLFIWIKELF